MAILFGVGLSIVTLLVLPFCAFLGALLSLLVVYRIAVSYGSFSIHTLLLGGVVLNAIFSALVLFLTTLAKVVRNKTRAEKIAFKTTPPNNNV